MPLDQEQFDRYARHVLLSDVGEAGQERLLGSTVEVRVGPDSAAEVAAIVYLAAAGVGRIVLTGLVEDPVTEPEVRRGLPYGLADVGLPRIEAIRERVTAVNPDVCVVAADEPGAVDARLPSISLPGEIDLARALIHGCAAATRLLGELCRSRH